MSQRKSPVDRLLGRIKKNPIVAVSIAIGTTVIAVSTFTDAAKNLTALATRQSPEEARAALGKMEIEYSPKSLVSKATEGDLVAVQLLLTAGADPDAKGDNDGNTALIAAAGEGHAAIVGALLDAEADVNASNGYSVTALMSAAAHGDPSVVHALLEARANVNQKRRGGDGALSFAAANNHQEIVKTLLDAGADADSINSGLIDALKYGNTDLARLLMKRGGDVKKIGAEALRRAITRDNINDEFGEEVRFILSLDIDVNGQNSQGFAPLHEAASAGNAAIVKALLAKGADVDLVCECDGYFSARKWTALQMAAMDGSPATIEALVVGGANVHYENTRKSTVLHLVGRGGESVIRLLVGKGADVNAPDIDGETPLMTLSGDDPVPTQVLLDHGADVNARDNDGWTPLMHDSYTFRDASARLLIERKADVNAKNAAGQTALMLAAGRGAIRVVRVLVEAHARLHEKDRDGRTALDYAMDGDSSDSRRVVALLKDRAGR